MMKLFRNDEGEHKPEDLKARRIALGMSEEQAQEMLCWLSFRADGCTYRAGFTDNATRRLSVAERKDPCIWGSEYAAVLRAAYAAALTAAEAAPGPAVPAVPDGVTVEDCGGCAAVETCGGQVASVDPVGHLLWLEKDHSPHALSALRYAVDLAEYRAAKHAAGEQQRKLDAVAAAEVSRAVAKREWNAASDAHDRACDALEVARKEAGL